MMHECDAMGKLLEEGPLEVEEVGDGQIVTSSVISSVDSAVSRIEREWTKAANGMRQPLTPEERDSILEEEGLSESEKKQAMDALKEMRRDVRRQRR